MKEKEFSKWLFEQGKEWIQNSSIRNVDRTAKVFVELLLDLEEDELADKLYKFYENHA